MNMQEQEDLHRTEYWGNITGGQWSCWTTTQRKNFKKRYKKYLGETRRDQMPGLPTLYNYGNNILDAIKKESAMNSAAHLNISAPAPTTESDENNTKRDHLRWRLNCINDNKKYKARSAFGLDDDEGPKSPQEIVDRIKAGKFVISKSWDDDMNEYGYSPHSVIAYLRWRDPAKVEDKVGYRAWRETTLAPAYNQLLDSITIKDPELALTELQAWESAA